MYGQNEITVSGRVTSVEDGSPLPGVSITVKGTTKGATSDAAGNYQIKAAPDATLVFSFIGMLPQEVSIGNRQTINVGLANDQKQLDEIVITGQGVGIEKKRLSTTVDVITSEQLKNTPAVRLDQLIQSKLPNAQIQLTSGQPGTASIMRSRGVASAFNSTTPVIYIDGVRVDNLNTQAALSLATGGAQSSSLADIPMENIERIEFVRGGAATTLYGADAANGVLQIFTKKGTAGQSRINFETQLGAQVGTKDFLKYKRTADVLFKPGFMQSYRLGFDGGNDKVTYSFSGNLYDDNSFRLGLKQTRYSLRTSLSAKVNKMVTYTGSLSYTGTKFTRDYNANTSFSTFSNLENGSYGDLNLYTPSEVDSLKSAVKNIENLVDVTENVNRFQTSHSVEIKPIDKITINATIGMDSRFSKQKDITTNMLLVALGAYPEGTNDQGTIDVYDRNFFTATGSLNAQYRENAGEFSFITTLGAQYFRNRDLQVHYSATNVTEGSKSINLAGDRSAEDYIATLTSYGFFGQENIGFKNKYFLEFGLRADGNSAFGEDIGLQYFPKVGVAYDLTSEEFMTSLSFISNLKLRGSFGIAGNFPPAFSRDRLVNVNSYLSTPTFTFGQPGDLNLKPEKTSTFEVGGDLGFFDNRLTVGLTYFSAITRDALFNAPFSPSTGQDRQLRNLGEIENKGFEVNASVGIVKNDNLDLTFTVSANTIKNKVLSSGGAPEFSIGGFTILGAFVKEGLPVGYFRGNKATFNETGQVSNIEPNANIGSPIPDLYGNSSITAVFKKRLTLNIAAAYQVGAEGVNLDEVLRFNNGVDQGKVPEASSNVSFANMTNMFVEKNDFLKVRNIALAYRLPERFYKGVFKTAEIGFNITNPLNFVSSKFDPEITGSGAPGQGNAQVTVGGFGYGTESAPRTYLGTIRVSF
ncbi:TonB-dependent receptor domain-containing protein [Xanthocytophaga agilis]|uniref:TonB-dependent receptor domain-containing protein n=1 Tax=Xanthocytophaga agilis TaxID=3048010 RepID=UPI0028D4CED3|nr:TonB-dependent receptor [Xanthocytophaga agilis]